MQDPWGDSANPWQVLQMYSASTAFLPHLQVQPLPACCAGELQHQSPGIVTSSSCPELIATARPLGFPAKPLVSTLRCYSNLMSMQMCHHVGMSPCGVAWEVAQSLGLPASRFRQSGASNCTSAASCFSRLLALPFSSWVASWEAVRDRCVVSRLFLKLSALARVFASSACVFCPSACMPLNCLRTCLAKEHINGASLPEILLG